MEPRPKSLQQDFYRQLPTWEAVLLSCKGKGRFYPQSGVNTMPQ
jgi:hypothetical protein